MIFVIKIFYRLWQEDVVIMKVGITLPQVGEMATRENVIGLAKAVDREKELTLYGS